MESAALDNYKEIAAQNVGAALIVTGTVTLTPQAKQPLELKAQHIEVEGTSSPDYPLQKKRHSVEFLRTIQHLRPRTNLFSAAFRVRSVAAFAITSLPEPGLRLCPHPHHHRQRLRGRRRDVPGDHPGPEQRAQKSRRHRGLYQDFFGKRASLTVSGQLNCENFAMAFGNVYTFGPPSGRKTPTPSATPPSSG